MMHSGSVAWPASSIKMCVKWLRGKQAETNLGKEFWNRNVKSSHGYNPSRIDYKSCSASLSYVSKGTTPSKYSTATIILFLLGQT